MSALPNADYDWAVNLPATVQAAGLTAVEACGEVGLIRGGNRVAETIRLTFEAARDRMPDDIDVEAGLKLLDDPATFEPNFIWYTAWGRRN
jgi:hypothetical protein